MQDGDIFVEIPIICNGSLSSTYYDITGVKRLIKVFNVTFTRLYEVSVNASQLFNIAYRDPYTGRLLGAAVNFSGDLKTHRIQAYFPDLKSLASSEIHMELPSYGVMLSLRPLEHKG